MSIFRFMAVRSHDGPLVSPPELLPYVPTNPTLFSYYSLRAKEFASDLPGGMDIQPCKPLHALVSVLERRP